METLARAASERGELLLRRRHDGHLELRANGVLVMDTLEHTAERAYGAPGHGRVGQYLLYTSRR